MVGDSPLILVTDDLSAEDTLVYLETLLEIGKVIDLSCFKCVKDFEGGVPQYARSMSLSDEDAESLIDDAHFFDFLSSENERREFLRDNFLSHVWLDDCITKLRTVEDDKRYLAMVNLISYNPDDLDSLCLTLRLNLAHCFFVVELIGLFQDQIANQVRVFRTQFIPAVVQKLEDFSQHQDRLHLDDYFNTRASVLALTDLEQEKQDLLEAVEQLDDLTERIRDVRDMVEAWVALFDEVFYRFNDDECFEKACAIEDSVQDKIQDLVMGDHPRISMSQLYVDHAVLNFQFRKFKELCRACETKPAHLHGGNIYLLYALLSTVIDGPAENAEE